LDTYLRSLYALSTHPPFHTVFLFIATPTTEIYPLSLHDALPIYAEATVGTRLGDALTTDLDDRRPGHGHLPDGPYDAAGHLATLDRKSTRLNSSHVAISYAVFCLKKKKS